ncbi:MAG: hypothetical protein JO232_01725 [Verrucomicrobia bacterium]|nr:hypothetical protein [Verrucomicrobiota bacterium]
MNSNPQPQLLISVYEIGNRGDWVCNFQTILKALKMNNIRLQRVLTSVSLMTQSCGFAMLGSLMTLHGGSDSGARIGGLLSVLTGTMFLMAAIAYWRTCHRQAGQGLGVLGIQAVASSAPARSELEQRSIRPMHREKRARRQIDGVGGALLATAASAFGAVL